MKTWLKILAAALAVLASAPSYGGARELSFEEMSEIVGGGGLLDTCGDSEFKCPGENHSPGNEEDCLALVRKK